VKGVREVPSPFLNEMTVGAGKDKGEPVSRPFNRLALLAGREGVLTAPLDFILRVTATEEWLG
jgi:hypothetical protein